jgi:hypothetical protein
VSVATAIQPPATVYREDQNFAWWVYLALALMATTTALTYLAVGPNAPGASGPRLSGLAVFLLVGLALPSVLVLGVLRMTTEVTPMTCRVWFGWIPTYRHAVPLSSISSVEVVSYRPLADCGGWGIRRGRDGERVLNARGDRGVRLTLSDGSRLLIGSQRPEELARALEQASRPQA